MTGLSVYLADKHRRYQANTIRHKKVLSFHFLGLRVFKDPDIRITDVDFCIALLFYREAMGEDYIFPGDLSGSAPFYYGVFGEYEKWGS